MPSMKCHECKKIAKCVAVAQRGTDGRDSLVYFCKPCRREYLADLESTQDASEASE